MRRSCVLSPRSGIELDSRVGSRMWKQNTRVVPPIHTRDDYRAVFRGTCFAQAPWGIGSPVPIPRRPDAPFDPARRVGLFALRSDRRTMSRIDQPMTFLARVEYRPVMLGFVGFGTLSGTQEIVDGPSPSSTCHGSRQHV